MSKLLYIAVSWTGAEDWDVFHLNARMLAKVPLHFANLYLKCALAIPSQEDKVLF